MITVDTIRRIIKEFPGAREESSYGTPGFKAGKKLFARMHQKEDAVVVLLGSIPRRDELIAFNPDTYYITDHYLNYGTVLVATTVAPDEFRALLTEAWKRVASKKDLTSFQESNSQ